MTLTETAMATKLRHRAGRDTTGEERDLALAWVHGKIGITQVAAALGVKTGGVYPFLANALKQHIMS